MEATYLVLSGPYFPPVLVVNPLVSFCLVKREGGKMEVLAEFIPEKSHRASEETRERFSQCANILNDPTVHPPARRAALQQLQNYLGDTVLVLGMYFGNRVRIETS